MIQPIFCGIDKFEFILHISLIILFLKRLYDFGMFFRLELFVNLLDESLQWLLVLLVICLNVAFNFKLGE